MIESIVNLIPEKVKAYYIDTPRPKVYFQEYHHKTRITVALPDNMSNKNVNYRIRKNKMRIKASRKGYNNEKTVILGIRPEHVKKTANRTYNPSRNWTIIEIYKQPYYKLKKIEQEKKRKKKKKKKRRMKKRKERNRRKTGR